MNTPISQIKTAVDAEVRLLRADLENAVNSHKWFMLAGLVIGFVIGAWLGHVL